MKLAEMLNRRMEIKMGDFLHQMLKHVMEDNLENTRAALLQYINQKGRY